jgi:hypothetical protein
MTTINVGQPAVLPFVHDDRRSLIGGWRVAEENLIGRGIHDIVRGIHSPITGGIRGSACGEKNRIYKHEEPTKRVRLHLQVPAFTQLTPLQQIVGHVHPPTVGQMHVPCWQ